MKLAAVCAPSDSDRARTTFFDRMATRMPEDVDLIVGDFNIVLRREDHSPPKRALSSSAAALRRLIEARNLEDPPPLGSPHTFFSRSSGYTARLDTVYATTSSHWNIRVGMPRDPGVSDHAPLLAYLDSQLAAPHSLVWRLPPHRLKNVNLMRDTNSLFAHLAGTTPEVVYRQWDRTKRSIKGMARSWPDPPIIPKIPSTDPLSRDRKSTRLNSSHT